MAGQPQLQIRVNRPAIARYGINVDDVQEAIETDVGGESVGQVFDKVRRFDINVRLQEPFRADPRAIGDLLIPAPNSAARVPLSQLAEIRTLAGPSRSATTTDSAASRSSSTSDMGGFVAEAQQAIAANVGLPPGYFVAWAASSRTSSGR